MKRGTKTTSKSPSLLPQRVQLVQEPLRAAAAPSPPPPAASCAPPARSARIDSASCSASAVRTTSYGFTTIASSPSSSYAPASRDSTSAQPVVGDDRDLLGDQVHAVPDRVDQRHVRQPVRGQRAGEVVLHMEDDRRASPPCRTRSLISVGHPLHLGRVVPVDREVLPGGVGEGDVHHALAPLGLVVEQLPVREQAAHDVLGQLGAVHPHDRLRGPSPTSSRSAAMPLVDVRPVRARPQEVRVRAQPVHADPGAGRRCRGRRTAPCSSAVNASAHRRVRNAGPVRAEHAAQQLLARCRPAAAGSSPTGAHGVCEKWPIRRSGRQLAQHPGDQGQVVVLHQDRRALRRLLGERLGEGRGCTPRTTPTARRNSASKTGSSGRLVEHVVDEPQHRVRDAVVRVGVHVGVDVQHPHARLARRPRRTASRSPSPSAAHTHSVPSGPMARQPGDQPAAAALGARASRPRRACTRPGRGWTRPGPGRWTELASSTCSVDHVAEPSPVGKPPKRRRSLTPATAPEPSAPHAARRSAYSAISAHRRPLLRVHRMRARHEPLLAPLELRQRRPHQMARGTAAAAPCGRSPPPSGPAPARPGGGGAHAHVHLGQRVQPHRCAARRPAGPAPRRNRRGTAAAPAASGAPRTRRPAAGRSRPAAASAD